VLAVHVTVTVGGRAVSVEGLADARLASTLRSAGQDIARRLAVVQCPVHDRAAHNVRIHFDERGNADLQYESCCEKLGKRVGEALGG
jgi:hypothetical protein